MSTVHTIGYSTHSVVQFVKLLQARGVNVICDVRSTPHSRWNPDFSQATLSVALKTMHIQYVFLGKELGARPRETSVYVNGQARYDRIAMQSFFRLGIQRILAGLEKGYRPALMCAEKDPLDCHRAILVCPHLLERGVEIHHILSNGEIETHAELEIRMLESFSLLPPPMFNTPETRAAAIVEGYERQGRRIAFVEKTADVRRNLSSE